MRQETGQFIFDFYSQTSTMWEQLSAVDPSLTCTKDIELFVKYRDRRKFMHFMMGLREDFEPTRDSLLSRFPTPSLDAAVKELILRRTVGLLITCHHLIMYWLHPLNGLPLLHSLLLHE